MSSKRNASQYITFQSCSSLFHPSPLWKSQPASSIFHPSTDTLWSSLTSSVFTPGYDFNTFMGGGSRWLSTHMAPFPNLSLIFLYIMLLTSFPCRNIKHEKRWINEEQDWLTYVQGPGWRGGMNCDRVRMSASVPPGGRGPGCAAGWGNGAGPLLESARR